MAYTNEIQLVNLDGLSDFERIDSNLRALIVSVEGTIPGSRGFGLSVGTADLRPEETRNTFYQDLDEKVELYIPEIMINDVEIGDMTDGTLSLQIYVEANEDMEDEND